MGIFPFDFLFHQHGKPMPSTTNPAAFTVAIEIRDEDCLMSLALLASLQVRLTTLNHEMAVLQRDQGILAAKAELAKRELFGRLETLHPALVEGHHGTGYRKHGDTYWYVGWDPIESGQKPG